jgi:hypothetical protein
MHIETSKWLTPLMFERMLGGYKFFLLISFSSNNSPICPAVLVIIIILKINYNIL